MNDQEMIAHHECDGGEEMNAVSRASIKRVANKLLEMQKNEKKYYAQFQNADSYNIELRKKYNEILKRLMKDE